ncbi:MAG: sulfate adenylyltransferase [Bacillota bacterium]
MPAVPHGGSLVNRLVPEAERPLLAEQAEHLTSVTLDAWSASDLEMIAVGGFSPLTGFLGSADYTSVVQDMRLQSGDVWPIPITLPVSRDLAALLGEGATVALRDLSGSLLGLMVVTERYLYDRQAEAQRVYRTDDPAHPGVAHLLSQGDVLLAGPVRLLQRRPRPFPDLPDEPEAVRQEFRRRGWQTVVAFQTRNPVHRAHEYIQKVALETVDGLFLQPLVGQTKGDDVPARVRVLSYRELLQRYYPPGRVLLGAYPAAMRYAGPREAVLHALARKNYGCTHFIVGRDHAGVGNYYGTYDAQTIFSEFAPGELGITPLFFEHTFYCSACEGMASDKTCPHGPEHHVALSGTRVREMLRRGEKPPREFSRPEVAEILIAGMAEPVAQPAGT